MSRLLQQNFCKFIDDSIDEIVPILTCISTGYTFVLSHSKITKLSRFNVVALADYIYHPYLWLVNKGLSRSDNPPNTVSHSQFNMLSES